MCSTDADLNSLLDKIRSEMFGMSSIQDHVLSFATRLSAIDVGHALLQQSALLLPDVYSLFCENLTQIANEHNITINKDI